MADGGRQPELIFSDWKRIITGTTCYDSCQFAVTETLERLMPDVNT